jgi:hypothetical protein
VAFGYCSDLSKSFTVMRPGQAAAPSTSGKLLDLVLREDGDRLVGVHAHAPVMSGILVMTSLT